MSGFSEDKAVITVLIQRLQTQRLPRVLRLKERVDAGERLANADLAFLKEVFADANRVKSLIDRNPEYHDLAARVMRLYAEITTKALENEQNR
ncbi:MAG: hypothetical protein V2J55_00370 [Candidatus Competibacteraceae bacterium]|jgi:hypothetical protein|nr:hypothetical protein [Candidatus Competibacteraceae bacterium]